MVPQPTPGALTNPAPIPVGGSCNRPPAGLAVRVADLELGVAARLLPGRSPRAGRRRPSAAVAAAVAAALVSGCVSGDADGGAGGSGAPAAAAGDARQLKGVCPDTVVVQTSWYPPEATHGGLYQLLGTAAGKGPTVDKDRKRIRGPLVAGGVDTGVQLEIRAGGGAASNQPVSALMVTDKTITLGQQATEDQVIGWAVGQPTVGVMAPLDADPVVFIWDRKRHPDFNILQDVGQTNTKVLTIPGSANTDYLTGSGIFRPSQIDSSYDGSPSRLMADRSVVVGGFATNEPFIYRALGVDVAYDYVRNAGYPNYRNMLAVRRDARQGLDGCLRRLVPILQRGMVEFMLKPEPVLDRIVKLGKDYGSPFAYPIEQARYGVKVMKEDGLVQNPATPRGAAFGAIDPGRVQQMLGILRPIYAARKQDVPADATPDQMATNTYIDPTVKLPAA